MIAVYLEQGTVSVREIAEAELPAGHARVQLLLGGICNTDLELQRGYYGFHGTPGHEFVGFVTEGPESWLGRRVVGEINLACGNCAACQAGWGRHCATRTVLGIIAHPGAFAERFTLPVSNLRAVPENVSDHHAVFTEPLAAACQILDQVTIGPGHSVAVLGDGKLGLLIAQVLAAHGARVTQFGRHAEKLAISAMAGVTTYLASDADLPRAEFPLVIEATGSPEGLNSAIAMTQPRGTVVMKSTVHGRVSIDTAAVIVNEITLLGSRCGRFEPALELLRRRAVQVDQMIDRQYPLSQAPEAFVRAATKGVLKVLLG